MGIDELFNGNEQPAEVPAEPTTPVEPEVPETPIAEEPPAPEQIAPQPQPEAPHEHSIPLKVALDWRDEAKRLRRELEQKNAQPPVEAPDPYNDPQGFAAHQNGQVEQALINQRFAMSDMMAREKHGADVVEKAAAWATERAQADPGFAQSYMRQQHPIEWIVQQHKRDALLSDIGDNMDDWFTREAAKRGYVAAPAPMVAAPAVTEQQPAPAPPRSLASVPSKGGGVKDVPTGPMAALGAVFRG